MVVVQRPTASDPISPVLLILREFGNLAAQLSAIPSGDLILTRMDDLRHMTQGGPLEADVVLDAKLPPERIQSALIWHSLVESTDPIPPLPYALSCGSQQLTIRSWTSDACPIYLAGAAVPPVLTVVADDHSAPEQFHGAVEGRPLVALYWCGDSDLKADKLLKSLSSLAWRVKRVDLTLAGSFLQWLEVDKVQKQALLRATAIGKALLSSVSLLTQVIDAQARTLRLKRAQVTQQLSTLQQRTVLPTATEVISEVRAAYESFLDSFKRGVAERCQLNLAAYSGMVWQQLERQLDAIQSLVWHRDGKVEIASLPDDVEISLKRLLSTELHAQCVRDVIALRDLWSVIDARAESIADSRGLSISTPQHDSINPEAFGTLLDRIVFFQRPYQGERSRHGIVEPLMQSRQYLFAVLMVLSSLGISWSVLGDPRFARWVWPARIALLLCGVVVTVRSLKLEDKQLKKREIEKAREWARGEFKRILGDFQRIWLNSLSEHLTDQMKQSVTVLEQSIRVGLNRRASDILDEKQQLQLQLQSLEVSEKRLAPLVRAKEPLASATSQLIGELRQLLTGS